MIRICQQCGNEYSGAGKKYCSNTCQGLAMKGTGQRHVKHCEHCGIAFRVYKYRSKTARYCSVECFDKGRVTLVERKCNSCGETFRKSPSLIAIGGGKYCSRQCYYDSRPQFTKECEVCGKVFVARRHGDTETKYCSTICMGLGRRGENGPGWKGGVTPQTKIMRSSSEYREWREGVYARDNWTCQDCGERGGILHAHHIFTFADFPEHQLEPWNGITLCKFCHAKQHTAMATALESSCFVE